ncbi:hypothetical protein Tco_0308602 [Tanacetum coccineum]
MDQNPWLSGHRVETSSWGLRLQTQLNSQPSMGSPGFEVQSKTTSHRLSRAVTFRDRYGVQMIMRFNEIHKFSDGTLQQIDEALDYREQGLHVRYPEKAKDTTYLSESGELCGWTDPRRRLRLWYMFPDPARAEGFYPGDILLVSLEVLRIKQKMEMEIPRSVESIHPTNVILIASS